jgi:uncharacterized protein (DUF58 family)
MQATHERQVSVHRTQFGLASMFECVTVCSLPLALQSVIGLPTALLLLATALALAMRQGFVALMFALGASLTADTRFATGSPDSSLTRQLLVVVLIGALACWYWARRSRQRSDVAA